jgi:hypothetical protein
MSIFQENPNEHFQHAAIHTEMLLAYKGARKKLLEGGTLWKKYKSELNKVRTFFLKFLGIGNLVEIAKWNRSASANEVSSCHQALEREVF